MNPRLAFAMVLLLLVAAIGAACTEEHTSVVASSADDVGITVTGQGEVQAIPDTGFFTVGVEVRGSSVEEARAGAATSADAVIASLKSNGIDSKDIQTSQLSINPEYDYRDPSKPRITGYVVTNTVQVKVRDLKKFSKVIDDAAAAGGNNARLQGVRFGVEDNAKALEQARAAAMADAKKKAEQLAKLGDLHLGKPVSISETQASAPSPIAEGAAGAPASDVKTPVEPGTTAVIVQVTVRWLIDS